ncbi:MAG TPA: hypothetical protein VGX48_17775 [Pyrinomonadaceae bacterium]|jgi:hypothetical protein|nr:hypothetical protein [Pyrinomonadaceae bacterium]
MSNSGRSLDLFGEPITAAPRAASPCDDVDTRRKPTRPQGYAATPGTGPDGETCGTCKHHVVITYSKDYHKCLEFRRRGGRWTHGPGSDIRVGSPACKLWEAKD